MELEKLWGTFSSEANKSDIADEKIQESIRIKSKAPIEKISNTLKIKLSWGILFSALSLGLLIYHINTFNLFIILAFSTLYFSLSTFLMYLKIKRAGKMDSAVSIKQFIKNYYLKVSSLLRAEEVESIFVIPVFAIIGILYSSLLIHGTYKAVLANTNMLLVTIIILVIAVPFAVLFVRWANKKAFGKYLEALQKIINNFDN